MWIYYYDADDNLCIQNNTPQTDWHKAVYDPDSYGWRIDDSERTVNNEYFKMDYLYIVTGTMGCLFNDFLRADKCDKLYYYSKMRKDAIGLLRGVFKSIPTCGGLKDVINQAFGEARKDENTMYVGSFVDSVADAYKEAIREKIMKRFDIKKAIFNEPYTIVIWEDGTKTIVKCAEGQTYDKYTGLTTCFLKRGFGDEAIYPRVRKQIRKVLADSDEKE